MCSSDLQSVMPGITSMEQTPDDPDSVRIHATQDGQDVFTDVDRKRLGAIMNGDYRTMGTFDWRDAQIEQKRQALAIQTARQKAQEEHWGRMDTLKRQFGNKPTAMILNAQAYANATGTSIADAMKMMAPGASRDRKSTRLNSSH